jgi:hypothetical protein
MAASFFMLMKTYLIKLVNSEVSELQASGYARIGDESVFDLGEGEKHSFPVNRVLEIQELLEEEGPGFLAW